MKKLLTDQGSSLVELIAVMTLMVLFGITAYTLIQTSVRTQSRIVAQNDAQSDAREALSYINVRLRQNDVKGKVSVERNALTGENALLLRGLDDEQDHDTWIIWVDGKLMEFLPDAGEPPEQERGLVITELDGFQTEMTGVATIRNTVMYAINGKQMRISNTLHLRSAHP